MGVFTRGNLLEPINFVVFGVVKFAFSNSITVLKMLIPSLFVIAVVSLLAFGFDVPIPVQDFLNERLTNDGFTTTRLVAIGFGIGLGLAVTPAKIILRYLSTLVHELGHAFVAGLLLASPKSIYIHPSAAGLALYRPSQNWGPGRITLTSAAGYVAPSLAALAAMNAVTKGHALAWAMFSVGVLAFSLLLLIRNLWGLFWTGAVIGGSYFGYGKLEVDLVGCIVAGIAGYLTVNAIQDSWMQLTITRRIPGSGCDAEILAGVTRLPAPLVAFGQWMVTVGLGFLTARLALSPHWADITNWVSDLY